MNTRSHRWRRGALMVAFAATAAGCYTTTIRSGSAPAAPTVEYDEKWHHGFVWGIAEVSGPYDLQKVCPNGWAEITTETSFLNGLVDAVTYGIYSPQTVTIRCTAGASPAASAVPTSVPAASSASPAPAAPPKPAGH